MKDFDAMLLSVVRARQRAGVIPDRPITLVFTADEEAGGVRVRTGWWSTILTCSRAAPRRSARWADSRPRSAASGCTSSSPARRASRGCGCAPTARPGTARWRNADNAITHLARALIALGEHEWPDEPGPSMQLLLDKVRELTGTDGTPDELLEHFGRPCA